MKKRITLPIIALLLFCTASFNALYAQSEYAIDACVHQVVNNIYKTRANNFNKYFKCRSPFRKWQCDTLSRADLDTLKNVLYRNPGFKLRSDSFFYAFHIFYGLEDTNIRLIYVPVLADYTGTDTSGVLQFSIQPALPGSTGTGAPDNSAAVFIRENGKLVRKPASDVMALMTSYRENIAIDAAGNGEWRGFADRDDELGDAKAILFPFQVIDALFNAGLNQENFEHIYVVSIAERDEINGLNIFKHSIAFCPVLPDNPNPAPIAENLGTLCPPGCISSPVQMMDHKPAPPYTYSGF